MRASIELVVGSSFEQPFVYMLGDDRVDITGWSAVLRVRDNNDSVVFTVNTDNTGDKTIVIDGTSGTLTATAQVSATSSLPAVTNGSYELELTEATGRVFRLVDGPAAIRPRGRRARDNKFIISRVTESAVTVDSSVVQAIYLVDRGPPGRSGAAGAPGPAGPAGADGAGSLWKTPLGATLTSRSKTQGFGLSLVDTGTEIRATPAPFPRVDVSTRITGNVSNLAACSTAQDGRTLGAKERVFLAGQTTASQNGVYLTGTPSAGTVALTKITSADDLAAAGNGLHVRVTLGTTYGKTFAHLGAAGVVTTIGNLGASHYEVDIEDFMLAADGDDIVPAFLRARDLLQHNSTIHIKRRSLYIADTAANGGPIVFEKSITIDGLGGILGTTCQVQFTGAGFAFLVTSNGSATGSRLRNLTMIGPSSTVGGDLHGVEYSTQLYMDNVTIQRFPGRGWFGRGRVSDTPNTNIDFSSHRLVRAVQNGLSGGWVEGDNGNQQTFISCSYESNGLRNVVGDRYGFWDVSFLGNHHLGSHSSGNAEWGHGTDPTKVGQRGSFTGCYDENNNPSYINGLNGISHSRLGNTGSCFNLGGGTDGGQISQFQMPRTVGATTITPTYGRAGTLQVFGWNITGTGANSGYVFAWTTDRMSYRYGSLSNREALAFTSPTANHGEGFTVFNRGVLLAGFRLTFVGDSRPSVLPVSTGLNTTSSADHPYITGDVVIPVIVGEGSPAYRVRDDTSGNLTWEALQSAGGKTISHTAQTASRALANIFTIAPYAGLYEVHALLTCTTADAGAGTVLATIEQTGRAGVATAESTVTLPLTAAGTLSRVFVVYCDGSNHPRYSTTVLLAGTSQYALDLRVRAL